jgi:hypothetical protein
VVDFDGWNPEARALVERAIATHGGREQWLATRSINLTFGAARGLLMDLKGYARTFPAPRHCEILPHDRTTIFHEYPDEDHRGRFVDGDVTIESLRTGRPSTESRDHRRTFTGLAKYRRWDALDALYFFGYALLHYHSVPFTLGGSRLVRVIAHSSRMDGIEVAFPGNVHTHSRRQRFFFGPDGRVLRHDYVAEIIGSWARGCHYWEAYERVDRLLIARRRRVVARVLGRPTCLTVLYVELGTPSNPLRDVTSA